MIPAIKIKVLKMQTSFLGHSFGRKSIVTGRALAQATPAIQFGQDQQVTANELCDVANMSRRAEFYAGRDARLCDLNGKQLFKIYSLLEQKAGAEAAQGFASVILNMKSLPASDVIGTLRQLEAADWKVAPNRAQDGGRAGIEALTEELQRRSQQGDALGASVILGVGFGFPKDTANSVDETASIKRDFIWQLKNAKKPIPEYPELPDPWAQFGHRRW
ncbi:MAG TPA: hypothetical protein V6C52_11800 [Coleofasciculaceae cyanobacterium]|jgi:hypothetical protein